MPPSLLPERLKGWTQSWVDREARKAYSWQKEGKHRRWNCEREWNCPRVSGSRKRGVGCEDEVGNGKRYMKTLQRLGF